MVRVLILEWDMRIGQASDPSYYHDGCELLVEAS
jgi:hypothetical protein